MNNYKTENNSLFWPSTCPNHGVHFNDPELNPSYAQLAAYYGVAVMPARPYKPKDKSKAEVGVQIVERWIMMRLRKLQLFSLDEANQAIRGLLDDLNNRPFKQRPGSRRSQFESIISLLLNHCLARLIAIAM